MEIKDLNHFKKLVKEGKIKDKWYFYKRTEKEIQFQINEIPQLIDYFNKNFGVILYPVSGTLLGIIRDGNFIAHDNDIDLAYLSLKNSKKLILEEFHDICDKLKTDGLLTKIKINGQLHCFWKKREFKYDIWTSFIINEKYYLCPILNGEIDKSIITPFKYNSFKNINILIPNNSEKLLDSIYENWKQIDYKIGGKNKWKNIL
jgi:hypothetical protein